MYVPIAWMITLRCREGGESHRVRRTSGDQIQVCLAPKLRYFPTFLFSSAALCRGYPGGECALEGGNLAVQWAPGSDQSHFPILRFSQFKVKMGNNPVLQ